MSSSSPTARGATDDLTRALSRALRDALAAYPTLAVDPGQLATRLAPGLAATLGRAAQAAGITGADLARGLAGAAGPRKPRDDQATEEERVLRALNRHTSGRSPGVTPDSLAALTGLPAAALGPVVSTLVQSGDLVRDGWLVRLPHADDLLPNRRLDEASQTPVAPEARESERRAIGDRRALGERRLYDRRVIG